jgi:hypothetical protein
VLEPDWPQHNRPAACVVTQQNYSVTFVSLQFHASKEKFGMLLKNVTISVSLYYFSKIA